MSDYECDLCMISDAGGVMRYERGNGYDFWACDTCPRTDIIHDEGDDAESRR